MYQQQIWRSRNYQFTSYVVHTVIMAGTLQFKRQPSSSFNSKYLNIVRDYCLLQVLYF